MAFERREWTGSLIPVPGNFQSEWLFVEISQSMLSQNVTTLSTSKIELFSFPFTPFLLLFFLFTLFSGWVSISFRKKKEERKKKEKNELYRDWQEKEIYLFVSPDPFFFFFFFFSFFLPSSFSGVILILLCDSSMFGYFEAVNSVPVNKAISFLGTEEGKEWCNKRRKRRKKERKKKEELGWKRDKEEEEH